MSKKSARRKKPAPAVHYPTTIANCSFTGVQWDAKAVDAVTKIADGLIENAKGLSALAQVLRASNVEIKSLLSIEDGEIRVGNGWFEP